MRNYITTSRKPYKLDKYKLYFDNPQLLGGWDINKEKDYRTVMLTKDGKYYFAIIDKGEHPFDNIPKDYLIIMDIIKNNLPTNTKCSQVFIQ